MKPYVYVRCFLLTVGLIVSTLPASFSQIKNPSSAISDPLLAAFKQLNQKQTEIAPSICITAENLPIETALEQALQYNLTGNWRCCEAMLTAIANHKKSLGALEKMHLFLAEADYLNSHQLYDSVKILATMANDEAGKKGWLTEKTRAMLLLSAGALKRRDMSLAYDWADSAIQLSRKTSNKLLEGRALLQMALCVRRNFTSATHRAFPYYLQAVDAAESVSDSLTVFGSNLYFADDHFEIGQWQEGLPYFNRAVVIALKSNNVYQLYKAYIGAGFPLAELGYFHEAIILFKLALLLSQQQKMPYNISHCYTQLAGTFQALKQNDSAIFYANLASLVPGVDSLWSNTWQLKAAIFNDMGNYKMATEMYIKAMDWANEDFLYRNQDQLNGYEAKLKTSEIELRSIQADKRNIQLEWMTLGVAMLLLLAAWAYLLQRRGRRKLLIQNAIIKKQQFELEKSLSEKEMLLKEIHHRVKNNLSVISSLLELQSNGITDEKAKAAIAEGQNRVTSIALIHQRLYQHENLAAIELEGFVRDMIAQVSSVFKRPGEIINHEIKLPVTLIDIDTAVPLGLIINELLTNSFKYAFLKTEEGRIFLQLTNGQNGNYMLTYADNGPGMPNGFDFQKSKSLGLRLIYRLSKQIGGNAEYVFDNGCKFIIHFKDAITRNREA